MPISDEPIGALSDERAGTLTIALGVLLLLSSLYVDHLALGEPTYRYERVQVTYVDGEVEYRSPGEDPFFPLLEVADVACLPGSS
ncbi:hypothetical protein [Halomicrococcus gelatinilyticus]|uniref:hypothetical protein n=1 Tax=Halomicrococcus gelatinilyticus TaxID=1702103 RepID=UPI002E14D1CD